MSKSFLLPEALDHYVCAVVTRETPVAQALREETARMPMHVMQISPDEAAFLAQLVRMQNARRVLEIGTFTGYSALAMAQALPDAGRLFACDISREWTDIARRYWREAGVEQKIELRLAPALETLAAMLNEGMAATFDLAFIDAEKTEYDAYFEACLTLLKPGGVMAFDNMLWSGAVADPSVCDAETLALRALNLKLRDDQRVDACMLTIADGVMLARKK